MTYTRLAAELAEREPYGVFRENDPIRTYPNASLGSLDRRLRRRATARAWPGWSSS